MAKFASYTSINPEESLAELRKLLNKNGATEFEYIETEDQIVINFEMRERRIKFTIPIPDSKGREFTTEMIGSNQYTKKRVELSPSQAVEKWKQAIRQKYRATFNIIKFKLMAIEEGATFEDEFLAHTLLPDGSTVGDWAKEQINQAYLTGKMPPLLLSGE